MEISRLIQLVRIAEVEVFRVYSDSIEPGSEQVRWGDDNVVGSMMVWVYKHPGEMALSPMGADQRLAINGKWNSEDYAVEFNLWFDGKVSDLTVEGVVDDACTVFTICGIHVL